MSEKPSMNRVTSKWVIAETDRIEKYYVLGEKLGQPGQFGYALLATHRESGQKRAVKVISKSRFARSAEKKYHFEQLRGEIEVMRRLNHPNIIKMYDVFETDTELYIVMELCSGGELFDRIKEYGSYSEKDASKVMRQMIEGLKYMHENKIAHCDLKPDNFLFLNEKHDSPIKIIDFGMSKFVQRRKYFSVICGTPYYVAPEVIEGRYSEHCDMWSMGVVLFVMLFGYPPFYADQNKYGNLTDQKIFQLIRKGFEAIVKDGYGAHFPKAIPISDSARDLIKKLLVLDTAKRLTAEEALEHPWLTGETASNTPIITTVIKNMQSFSSSCKFKQALLQYMANTISDEEMQTFKKIFSSLDENGDGVITINEFKKAMSKGGHSMSGDELEKLLKLVDVDGDGNLSYQELVMASVQRKISAKEERLWETFCKLDLNGDGMLTAEEIEKVLGAKEARAIIAEVDSNGDGVINYDEFITMWSGKQ